MHPGHVSPTIPPVNPRRRLFDGLSREQKTVGIIGLISIILLTMCCCFGWLSAFLITGDKESSSTSDHLTPDPSPSFHELGKLYGEGSVSSVSSGDLIEISLAEQMRQVKVIGIAAPTTSGEASQCWANESKQFAEQTLVNQNVRLFSAADPSDVAQNPVQLHVVMSDDTNFAIRALEAGAVKKSDMEPGELANKFRAAEHLADESNKGIWGEPCNGSIDLPQATQPSAATPPEPAQPPTQQSVPAVPAPAPPVVEPDTYYASCSDARAAGAAPMYRGEPGYRTSLDRDNDGIACDS